jgi:hypothetical protein
MELNGVTRFCLGIFTHALPLDQSGYGTFRVIA